MCCSAIERTRLEKLMKHSCVTLAYAQASAMRRCHSSYYKPLHITISSRGHHTFMALSLCTCARWIVWRLHSHGEYSYWLVNRVHLACADVSRAWLVPIQLSLYMYMSVISSFNSIQFLPTNKKWVIGKTHEWYLNNTRQVPTKHTSTWLTHRACKTHEFLFKVWITHEKSLNNTRA